MGFPRIPFLDPFLTKMVFFMGGPVTYIQIRLNRTFKVVPLKT